MFCKRNLYIKRAHRRICHKKAISKKSTFVPKNARIYGSFVLWMSVHTLKAIHTNHRARCKVPNLNKQLDKVWQKSYFKIGYSTILLCNNRDRLLQKGVGLIFRSPNSSSSNNAHNVNNNGDCNNNKVNTSNNAARAD